MLRIWSMNLFGEWKRREKASLTIKLFSKFHLFSLLYDIAKVHRNKNCICRKVCTCYLLVVEKTERAIRLNLQALYVNIKTKHIFVQDVSFIFISKVYFVMLRLRIVLKFLPIFNMHEFQLNGTYAVLYKDVERTDGITFLTLPVITYK